MKKIILLLFSGISLTNAQPAIQWQKSFGGTNGDLAHSVQQTIDGGYIIAGITSSTNGDVSSLKGNDDFWVVKTSSVGVIQWQKCLGGTNFDQAYSIQQTADSGYVVVGFAASNNGDVTVNQGSDDFWIVKLSSTGTIQWQKTAGGTLGDNAFSVQQTADGGYIIAGDTQSNNGDVSGNHGSYDSWILKLTNTGSIQWAKCLGGTSDDTAASIQQTADGGYIIAGSTLSNNGDVSGNNGNWDYWIVKLNSTGTIQWQKCLGGTGEDIGYSIRQTLDSGYVVAGYTKSNNGDVTGNHSVGVPDYWVVKLNTAGVIQWQKCLGGTGDDKAYSIRQTADSGYVVTGFAKSNNGDVSGNHALGFQDYWLVKLTGTGIIQWQICLGGTNDDWARSIKQTTDGGYIIAGWSKSNNGDVTFNNGNNDFWVVKLGPYVTGVPGEFNSVRKWEFFPNPSTGIFSITTNLVHNADLKILNPLGQIVYESKLNNEKTLVDLSAYSPGIYFAVIIDENHKWTKKIIIE
jgi:hypothetical protein